MVLVTHHLEEVPPGFTHAMLLRDGGVVAPGPIGEVLTEDNLSTRSACRWTSATTPAATPPLARRLGGP